MVNTPKVLTIPRPRSTKWQVWVDCPATLPRPRVKPKPIAKGDFNPPKHEIQAFARCILPTIQAYFDTEKGRREFAEWVKQQAEQDGSRKTA